MFYLFKSAWKYADKDKWKLVVCYILHTISISGELLQPYAFGMAVNALQIYGIANLKPAVFWFGLYFAGFLIFQLFHHTGRYFECTTALKNQQRLTARVYEKLYGLPVKWHVDHHSGEIVNRIKVAGEALRDFCFRQSNFMEYAILSVGPILVLANMNYRIAVISLVLISINLAVVFRMNKAIQPILDRQNETFHTFSAQLSDFAGNIRTVIALRLGSQTGKELNRLFHEHFVQNMREFWINQPRCSIMSFGSIITELTVILYYIWSCRFPGEVFKVGNLVMIITYFRQVNSAIDAIADSFYDTMHWKASIRSADVILNEAQQQPVQEIDVSGRTWSGLSLKNLGFKYCSSRFGLSGMELELYKNSRIAVVGASGSGKSTLLQLLAGLYEPDSVELLVDGKRHTGLKNVAGTAILISQDSEIFENTILYNITFGLTPDPAELERAIDTARLREVIDRLPDGIDTDIREKGVNLSGGEKQRLALARGLYFARAKSILLLDEITSSVDAINEKLIMQGILDKNRDRCVISSIHRLHLLDMFDTVLVMDRGRIIQKGSFPELVNAEGHFRTLWNRYQTEGAESTG